MGDLLIRILEEQQGHFVSGEEIGRWMGTFDLRWKSPRREPTTLMFASVRLAVRRKSRDRLIRRINEVDPLLCRCGERMRIVGFITRTPEATACVAGSVMSGVDPATETRRPDRGNCPPG